MATIIVKTAFLHMGLTPHPSSLSTMGKIPKNADNDEDRMRMEMIIGQTPCGGSMQGKPQSGQESVKEELDEMTGLLWRCND